MPQTMDTPPPSHSISTTHPRGCHCINESMYPSISMDESWYHCYLSKCDVNLARASCLCHQGPFWQRDPIWAQNQTGVWRRQTAKDESRSRRSPSWTWLLILMYYLRAAPIATALTQSPHHINDGIHYTTHLRQSMWTVLPPTNTVVVEHAHTFLRGATICVGKWTTHLHIVNHNGSEEPSNRSIAFLDLLKTIT